MKQYQIPGCRSMYKATMLIGLHERLLSVPEPEQLTLRLDEYGGFVFRHGLSETEIAAAYEKALTDAELGGEEFQAEERFFYASDIICRLRDCLLARQLERSDGVLFAYVRGWSEENGIPIKSANVESVDPIGKTCNLRCMWFSMQDVPLHDVLALIDPNSDEVHYGLPNIKPLFGEFSDISQFYQDEIREYQQESVARKQKAEMTM